MLQLQGKLLIIKKLEQVYQAIKILKGRVSVPIRLFLLGSAKKKEAQIVENEFINITYDNFEIDYSNTYVPAEEFSEKLKQVDFIIAPIKQLAYKIKLFNRY